jgi:hypothetical protein
MDAPRHKRLLGRLGWFVLLWAAGVLAVAAFAYALRALIPTLPQ